MAISLLDFFFHRPVAERDKEYMKAALPCPRAQGQAPCTPLSQRTGSRPSLSWSAAAPAPPCPSHGGRAMRAVGGSAILD